MGAYFLCRSAVRLYEPFCTPCFGLDRSVRRNLRRAGAGGMLIILSDGSSLSASALAEAAGMSPQTASSHLAKLLESYCKLGWEQLQRQPGVQPLA